METCVAIFDPSNIKVAFNEPFNGSENENLMSSFKNRNHRNEHKNNLLIETFFFFKKREKNKLWTIPIVFLSSSCTSFLLFFLCFLSNQSQNRGNPTKPGLNR